MNIDKIKTICLLVLGISLMLVGLGGVISAIIMEFVSENASGFGYFGIAPIIIGYYIINSI